MSLGAPLEEFDFDAPYRPFVEPLGRLVFAFSNLEKDLNWCVSALADLGRFNLPAQVMPGKTGSFTTQLKKVRAHVRERCESHEDWASLDARMLTLGEFRNFAIHGLWSAFSATAWGTVPAWQVQKVDPRTNLLTFREISVTELQNAVNEAQRLSVEIMSYVQAIVDPRI